MSIFAGAFDAAGELWPKAVETKTARQEILTNGRNGIINKTLSSYPDQAIGAGHPHFQYNPEPRDRSLKPVDLSERLRAA